MNGAPRRRQPDLPRAVALVVVGAATLALPLVLNTPQLTIYVTVGLFTMAVAGLSLLMGFAGQVSLGQGAFYGIGAYTAAIMAVHGWPPLLALVLAPVMTTAIAVVLGAVLLRLRGHALAFGTLAVQLIFLSVLSQTPSLTGGDVGLSGIPALGIGSLTLTSHLGYAYFVWLAAAAVLLVSRNITRSRPGRGLRAMATAPSAAAATGVNVVSYRLRDFALSAAYAGLAGGIYAFYLGYISPDAFPIMLSIEFVIMVVVGGLGTVSGAFVGAAAITVVTQVLSSLGTGPTLPAQLPAVLSDGVYALILITVLRLLPDGIVGACSRLARGAVAAGARVARRREPPPVGEAEAAPVVASAEPAQPEIAGLVPPRRGA